MQKIKKNNEIYIQMKCSFSYDLVYLLHCFISICKRNHLINRCLCIDFSPERIISSGDKHCLADRAMCASDLRAPYTINLHCGIGTTTHKDVHDIMVDGIKFVNLKLTCDSARTFALAMRAMSWPLPRKCSNS
jgi:hypothetical protein